MQISSFRRLAVLPLGLLLAAACASTPPPPPPVSCCEVDWGYEAPEHWADLSPCYYECGEGGEQSPIDIVNPQQKPPLPAVDFAAYGTVPDLVARHDGHTIRIDIPRPKAGQPLASLELGGVTYRLDQFHFHTPSEHTIRGNDRPIEMHFVNISPGGRVVAVAVFIKDGPSNPELAKIWQDLPKEKGQSRPVGALNLGRLLPPPAERSSYRYAGSLTNPPCGQGYQWIVYSQAITLAEAEIGELRKIFSGREFPDGNRRRPLQPLNGRIVLTDVPRL